MTTPTGQIVIRTKGDPRETDLIKPQGPKPRAKAARAEYEAALQAYKDATDPLEIATRYNLYYENDKLVLVTESGWKLAADDLKEDTLNLLAEKTAGEAWVELYINNMLVLKNEPEYSNVDLNKFVELFSATLP